MTEWINEDMLRMLVYMGLYFVLLLVIGILSAVKRVKTCQNSNFRTLHQLHQRKSSINSVAGLSHASHSSRSASFSISRDSLSNTSNHSNATDNGVNVNAADRLGQLQSPTAPTIAKLAKLEKLDKSETVASVHVDKDEPVSPRSLASGPILSPESSNKFDWSKANSMRTSIAKKHTLSLPGIPLVSNKSESGEDKENNANNADNADDGDETIIRVLDANNVNELAMSSNMQSDIYKNRADPDDKITWNLQINAYASGTNIDIRYENQTPTSNPDRNIDALKNHLSISFAPASQRDDDDFSCERCVDILCSKAFCETWCKDIIVQRSIYGTVLVYAFDVITDFNVMIFFFGQDRYYFGYLSLAILIWYRFVSAWSVFYATPRYLGVSRRLGAAFLQILDVYIFFEVFQSHQLRHKSDRLRWINSMEAALESAPQCILQTAYLILFQEVRLTQTNNLVTLGLFFSICKLGATAIGADSVSVHEDARHFCGSYKYLIRFFFRIFEMSSRVLMYCLLWIVIGMKWLAILIFFHIAHNFILFLGGCLGREIFNIFGFIIYIPKLNRTLQEGIQLKALQKRWYLCIKWYINWYRNESSFEQSKFVVLRSIEQVSVLTGIFIYDILENNNGDMTLFSRFDEQVLVLRVLFMLTIVMSIMVPILWVCILEAKIIDFDVKKEEFAFKSIFKAIKYARLDAIKKQFNDLKSVTGPNRKSKTKQTPLHYACEKQRPKILFWMLTDSTFIDNSNVNVLDKFGQSPFMIACKFGSLSCVKILYSSKLSIDTNIRNEKQESAIYIACKYGHFKIVRYLLSTVNISQEFLNDKTSTSCGTPLHIACDRGHLECVTELLRHKHVQINLLNQKSGDAPIHICVKKKHVKISSILMQDKRIELSAENWDKLWYLTIKNNDAALLLKLLATNRFKVLNPCGWIETRDKVMSQLDTNMYAPLFVATRYDAGDVARTLLKISDANINECDPLGFTPLYLACEEAKVSAALALLECTKVDMLYRCEKGVKNTTFIAACKGGSIEIVNELINKITKRHDANKLRKEMNRINKLGQTSLHIACEYDSHQVLNKLVHGFDLNLEVKCKRGKTPLMTAQQNKNAKSIQVLNLVDSINNNFDAL